MARSRRKPGRRGVTVVWRKLRGARSGRRTGKRRRAARPGIWVKGGLLALAILAALWVVREIVTWPDVAVLAERNPATTAFIERYRRQQRAAGRPDRVARTWVPYSAISDNLKRAVLVAEDINFFSHHGFDTGEMRAAVREALGKGELPRGASTITQQLARNLWLSPSRNPWRKLEEAVLTWQLERALPKKRILELYLNVVEFGPGVYGAEAAARRYFGKRAARLSRRQAARLAAGLPNPGAWNPARLPADHWRVRTILRRMAKATFLQRLVGVAGSRAEFARASRGRRGGAGAGSTGPRPFAPLPVSAGRTPSSSPRWRGRSSRGSSCAG